MPDHPVPLHELADIPAGDPPTYTAHNIGDVPLTTVAQGETFVLEPGEARNFDTPDVELRGDASLVPYLNLIES